MRKILPLLLASLSMAEAPLTLDDCRRLAREKNADVATARMELDGAGQTRKAAFTKYFPQVSAAAGIMTAWDPMARASTSAMKYPVMDGNDAVSSNYLGIPALSLKAGQNANVLALTVLQPIFAGGRIHEGNRLASLGEDVARSKVALAERDAVAQAEEKYWTLLSLQEKRRTLAAYDTLLGSLQAQVDDAVAHGLASRNDKLKVGLKRGEVRVNRLQLESGLRLATRDLRQHLGLAEDSSLALSDTLAVPDEPAKLEALRRGAVDRRIESRLLAQGVRAEQLQADMESGTRLPTVAVGINAIRADVSASVTTMGSTTNADPTTNVIFFAMASIPISDAWGETYSTEAKKVKVREAALRESEMRRKIGLGVDKDWDDLVRAYQANLVADDGVAQAEENQKVETDRHRNGISNISDLLDAQALRQQAMDKRIDSRKDYWMAHAAFLRSTATESVK